MRMNTSSCGASDLPVKYYNWEQHLTNLDSKEKLNKFLTELSQVVEKQTTNQTSPTSQPKPNYLGLKITLGTGASLMVIINFLLTTRKRKKEKQSWNKND